MIIFLSLIISLILMPLVVHERGWQVKTFFLMACIAFTPIVGIIVYKFVGGK